MQHMFDTEHARQYGLEEAVFLWNLLHWVVHNRANGENFREGRTWSYNTVEAFSEQFTYMSKDCIRRTIKSLLKQGVIVSGNFNERATNRTLWYAFADEDTFLPTLSHLAESPNRDGKTAQSHVAKSPNGSGKNANSLIRADVNAHVNADSRRGARLPDDWVLLKSWAKVAFEIWPNWTPDHCRFEADKFRDHWHAKAGRDACKRDWLATWRNWVRSAGAMRVEKGGMGAQWWHSEEAALAKAREVGVGPALAGDTKDTWHARIRAAIDNGGKPPAPRQHTPTPTAGPAKIEPRAAVSEANRAALLDAAKKAGATRHLGDQP